MIVSKSVVGHISSIIHVSCLLNNRFAGGCSVTIIDVHSLACPPNR
jgi:hypothetical protein